jgi:hypothetical protein
MTQKMRHGFILFSPFVRTEEDVMKQIKCPIKREEEELKKPHSEAQSNKKGFTFTYEYI